MPTTTTLREESERQGGFYVPEIAKDIGQRTDNGRKRFPLPVVVDDNALGKEKPIPLVTQHNQYDIDFLFQRARMRGYVVFVQEEDRTTGRKRQLYFGPS